MYLHRMTSYCNIIEVRTTRRKIKARLRASLLAYVEDEWMPKAWKILFLKPGLLGLASWWPPADCPSLCSSALCASELFACVRTIARVRASVRGVDGQNSFRGEPGRTFNEKKNKKKEEKEIVDLKHSKFECSSYVEHARGSSASRLTSRRRRVRNWDTHLIVTLFVLAVSQTGARAASGRSLLVAQQLRHSCLVHQLQRLCICNVKRERSCEKYFVNARFQIKAT